jgi:hypothetical protein
VTDPDDLLLDALTPLGFRVRVTHQRWELIITAKHPVMAGREGSVRTALEAPDEVRQSRIDQQVRYPTDGIKEGVRIWPK